MDEKLLDAIKKVQKILQEKPLPNEFTYRMSEAEWIKFKASITGYEIIDMSSPHALELLKEKCN